MFFYLPWPGEYLTTELNSLSVCSPTISRSALHSTRCSCLQVNDFWILNSFGARLKARISSTEGQKRMQCVVPCVQVKNTKLKLHRLVFLNRLQKCGMCV